MGEDIAVKPEFWHYLIKQCGEQLQMKQSFQGGVKGRWSLLYNVLALNYSSCHVLQLDTQL